MTQTPIQLLVDAAKNGNAQDVKRLLSLIPTHQYGRCTFALIEAAVGGHSECVRLLIPVSDPKAQGSYALRCAAEKGHIECVKLLIPVSEPDIDDSYALRGASYHNHINCVDILFEVSDPHTALDALQTYFPEEPKRWQYLSNKIEAVQQRSILISELKDNPENRSPNGRKM